LAIAALLSALGTGPARAENAGATIAADGTPGGAPACLSCHGTHGEGNAAAGYPRLAGLSAPYIQAQLAAFASGQRENPIMTPVAKMLSADEARVIATYYAHLPGPSLPKVTPAATSAGAILALDGRWTDGIPACVVCHGPGGIGVGATFPPLAGQPASYLKAQLEAWQQGTRPPGPLGLMGAVAKRLTPADIEAVSNWFATLAGGTGK
jgi:cytochrome c553